MASKKSEMEVNASHINISVGFITLSFWGNRPEIVELNKGKLVREIYWIFPNKRRLSNIWFEKLDNYK